MARDGRWTYMQRARVWSITLFALTRNACAPDAAVVETEPGTDASQTEPTFEREDDSDESPSTKRDAGGRDASRRDASSTDASTLDASSPSNGLDAGVGLRVSRIAASNGHVCAVLPGGSIKCWGDNTFGELGAGSNSPEALVPVAVSGVTGAIGVAVGSSHSCALLSSGSVKCWGYNAQGQLGDGTTISSRVPVTVPGIFDAVSLACTTHATCVVDGSGSVHCWGKQNVGTYPLAPLLTPTPVSGLAGVRSIHGGASSRNLCAVLSNGDVRCWGENEHGELGYGAANYNFATVPVPMLGVSPAVGAGQGSGFSCVLLANGGVKCAGANTFGQIGSGALPLSPSTIQYNVAVDVKGVAGAVALSSGLMQSCAVVRGGDVWCWGNRRNNYQPTQVAGVSNAIDVACDDVSCALLADDTVKCWGANARGLYGNGTKIDSPTPVTVLSIP